MGRGLPILHVQSRVRLSALQCGVSFPECNAIWINRDSYLHNKCPSKKYLLFSKHKRIRAAFTNFFYVVPFSSFFWFWWLHATLFRFIVFFLQVRYFQLYKCITCDENRFLYSSLLPLGRRIFIPKVPCTAQ